MILIGVDDRGQTYTIRGFNGGGRVTSIGHDIARMKLVKIVEPERREETLMQDFAFGAVVVLVTFLMLFWSRHMMADLFLFTWKQLAG